MDTARKAKPASGEYLTVPPSNRPSPLERADATYIEQADAELFRICAAMGYEADYERFRAVQRIMLGDWGGTSIPNHAPYASEIGDDHSPYEFSLQFEAGAVELRLLVEAQGNEPSAQGNLDAALELNRRLQERYSLDMSRLARVYDLFLSGGAIAPFSLWHAVCWLPGTAPAFKLYLNPRVRGRDHARGVIDEALARLGMSLEAHSYLDQLTRSSDDELRYFSLDLSEGLKSRVKVYVTHHAADAGELEQVMSMSPHHQAGDVPRFCQAMTGHLGPFTEKSVTTCISFVEGTPEPYAMTLHLPVAHYVDNDQVTASRVARFLRENGLDHLRYRRAINVFASRGLDDGVGVQSYASYRREAVGLHFSAYLSPELFRGANSDDTQTRQVMQQKPTGERSGVRESAKR